MARGERAHRIAGIGGRLLRARDVAVVRPVVDARQAPRQGECAQPVDVLQRGRRCGRSSASARSRSRAMPSSEAHVNSAP
jgi:hypothetical protein